jgi:hypothetical protein
MSRVQTFYRHHKFTLTFLASVAVVALASR